MPTTPTISIGTIAGDDRINGLEASQGVAIGGTTTSVEDGQVVTVTIVDGSGHTVDILTASVTNNSWTAQLTPAQAEGLVANVYTVKADVSDLAGNPAPEATDTINQTAANLYFTGNVSSDWTQNIIDQGSQAIVSTNWTGNATPGAGDNVEIGPGSPDTTVVVGSNVYQHTSAPLVVNSLIVNSGITLNQAAGPLTIGSLLSNSGNINVTAGPLVASGEIANSGQMSFTNSELELAGTVVLDGAGTVNMAVNPNPGGYNNDLITGSNVNAVATLENFSTIQGIGLIGSDGDTTNHFAAPLVVHNHGIIDATDNAQQLVIHTTFASLADALTNDGTLEDTGQAGLVIFETNVVQTSQGAIDAIGTGAHVDLAGAIIDGGIIDGSGGGVVQTVNSGGISMLDGSTAAGTVDNTGAFLVTDQSALALQGSIRNTGTMTLHSTGHGAQLEVGAGDATLTGHGDVVLETLANDYNYNNITGTSTTVRTTLHNVDNKMSGSGVIGTLGGFGGPGYLLALDNQAAGVIDATDNAGNQLTIATGATVENAGVLEATGTAGLVIQGDTVDQNPNLDQVTGDIGATGAGSHVDLEGATIDGGTLTTADGGVIQTIGGLGSTTLDGSTAAGAVDNTGATVVNGAPLTLAGAIDNSGSISLDSGADLQIASGDATLTGGGSVVIQRSTGDYNNADITGSSTTTPTTLHNVDNTISGAGVIGPGAYKSDYLLALDNQAAGTIDATGNADSTLTIATSAGVGNAGIIEDTGTAGLIIQNTTVTQSGAGVIEATGAGTHVDLDGATIDGGTLNTASGGVIQTTAASELDGGTAAGAVTNLGAISVRDPLTLAGAIDNSGSISLNSGADLQIASGDATLTGGGTVVIQRSPGDYNNADITGSSTTTPTTLHNVDDTISGTGSIGPGAYKSDYLLALDNEAGGVIEATDSASALTLQTGATIINDGTLEGNGGELSVSDPVSGTGHATISAGGSIQFAGNFQENTAFVGGDGAGNLTLADAYSGTVSGFLDGDSIDLGFLAADPTDSKVYVPNGAGTGGTLSILDAGGQTLATLQLSGGYSGSSEFALGHDNQNHMVVTTSASDGPTVTGTVAGQATNDKSTVTPFAHVSIGNVANPAEAEAVTVTLDHSADGLLSTASGFTLTSPGVYSFSGTAAAATAAIDALVFTPTAHQVAPGSAVTTGFTIGVDDGHGGTASDATTSVVATAADDPPVIGGTKTAHISDEQTAAPFSSATVTDIDSGVSGITATITFAGADGSFTAASLLAAGFTGSNGSYSTVAGIAATALQASLRQLVFVPTAHQVAPGQGVTTDFTLALNDQHGGTPSDATTAVVATAADDPPVIGGTKTAHISDKQTAAPFSSATVTDVDSGVSGITATITFTGADGSFTAASLLAAGFTGSNGSYSTVAGIAATALQASLRQLVFVPTAHQVAPGQSVTTDFTLALNDQHGGTPSDATTAVVATAGSLSPTSAALIQESNGALDYLEFAGSTLLGSDQVSQYGWNIAAEGDFNNDGRADLVTQDPKSGAIDLLFLKNGALQGSLLEEGDYWKVVGAGDFDGSGRTGIATQSATGQIDLLWFTGTQLSSSELLKGLYQPVVGVADFNGDGKADFVTQSQGGGPLDFLFFNNASLTGSALTSQSFSPVHDATNTGVPGQSVLLSQIPSSGNIDYLQFNGTSLAGTQLESANLGGDSVIQGTEVSAQLFSPH